MEGKKEGGKGVVGKERRKEGHRGGDKEPMGPFLIQKGHSFPSRINEYNCYNYRYLRVTLHIYILS